MKKCKYLLKRLSRREESFPSHSMAYSGLTVENGVFVKKRSSLVDNIFNRYLRYSSS